MIVHTGDDGVASPSDLKLIGRRLKVGIMIMMELLMCNDTPGLAPGGDILEMEYGHCTIRHDVVVFHKSPSMVQMTTF